MDIQREIIRVLNKISKKDGSNIDPTKFHEIIPEIKSLLELDSPSMVRTSKELLAANRLLTADGKRCDAPVNFVIKAMDVYAKQKALDFMTFVLEREPEEDEPFYGPKKLEELYDTFNRNQ